MMDRKNMLMVDIEQDMLHTVEYVMEVANCSIAAVEDSREALKKTLAMISKDIPIDLLMVDIRMSDLTGMELMNELSCLNIAVPVLVITEYGHKGVVIWLTKDEPKEYLGKPFDDREFVKRLAMLFHDRG